jgi:hypothetical protein
VVRKDGTPVHYRTVARRKPDGTYAFHGPAGLSFFETLADRTDRTVDACHEEFERKRRYVEYLRRAGVDDLQTLFGLLSDLRTDEAATVERIASDLRTIDGPGETAPDAADGGDG